MIKEDKGRIIVMGNDICRFNYKNSIACICKLMVNNLTTIFTILHVYCKFLFKNDRIIISLLI